MDDDDESSRCRPWEGRGAPVEVIEHYQRPQSSGQSREQFGTGVVNLEGGPCFPGAGIVQSDWAKWRVAGGQIVTAAH